MYHSFLTFHKVVWKRALGVVTAYSIGWVYGILANTQTIDDLAASTKAARGKHTRASREQEMGIVLLSPSDTPSFYKLCAWECRIRR